MSEIIMSGFSSGKTFIVPTIILGLGAMTVASAHSKANGSELHTACE